MSTLRLATDSSTTSLTSSAWVSPAASPEVIASAPSCGEAPLRRQREMRSEIFTRHEAKSWTNLELVTSAATGS